MDAIPIDEPAGCSFGSVHPGAMHACGHDGHMAMMIGLAAWASKRRASLKRGILLVFQAAEETTGGAASIVDSGVLADYGVSRIYGLHLWPGFPLGTVICRPKEFMAGTYVIEIEVTGKAAHIAEYTKGIDAMEAGLRLVKDAYVFEKSLPKETFRILRFGTFNSGTTNNVVASKAVLTGALRAFDERTYNAMNTGMKKLAAEIQASSGAGFEFHYSKGYPAVINPEALAGEARQKLTGAGFAWLEPELPYMQAEDFSYYQLAVPGLYMHLGTGGAAKLHAPDYTLDETALGYGLKLWTTLAEDAL